jgi:hypothetical protein
VSTHLFIQRVKRRALCSSTSNAAHTSNTVTVIILYVICHSVHNCLKSMKVIPKVRYTRIFHPIVRPNFQPQYHFELYVTCAFFLLVWISFCTNLMPVKCFPLMNIYYFLYVCVPYFWNRCLQTVLRTCCSLK